MSNSLSPSQIYNLSMTAYQTKDRGLKMLKREFELQLPFLNIETLSIINATSGLFSGTASGFGFMAQLKGNRSKEIVIATRGTVSAADVGTDINVISAPGPTGHLIHKGFGTTFKSYVQQLNEFIKLQNLGFKPTAVHCMGHSLGGALANLNAAACAELGFGSYLYTVAAPRVGMVPYAEHLSSKMNASQVFRVANEADVVTMVPCFPFVHAPYAKGTYLLDGGLLKINPMQHKLSNGYKSMINTSWTQLQSLTKSKQQQLEQSMTLYSKADQDDRFGPLAKMPGAMLSSNLLKLINSAINELMTRMGAQSLLCVSHYGSGSFTVLDQVSELSARYAHGCARRAKEVTTLLSAIMTYLGHSAQTVADASLTTIRWVFNMLHQSISTMAKQAIYLASK